MIASSAKRKICVFGTHHAYQYLVPRPRYLRYLKELIDLHSVDLVAEEATGVSSTYIQQELLKPEFKSVSWKNVDLTREERTRVPDINESSIGTLVDLDLHELREWVWVIRTSEATKGSALLICGLVHTFSVAEKFLSAGFEAETHVYFDNLDEPIRVGASSK